MITKKTGELNQIWEEKRKVKIGEEWFNLAENIKINYVKRGVVEYNLDNENPKKIIFIKSVSNSQIPNEVSEEPPKKEHCSHHTCNG